MCPICMNPIKLVTDNSDEAVASYHAWLAKRNKGESSPSFDTRVVLPVIQKAKRARAETNQQQALQEEISFSCPKEFLFLCSVFVWFW